MTSRDEIFYTRPLERFVLIRRRTNVGSALSKSLLKVIHTLSNWQGCSPLTYSPSLQRYIDLSESGLVAYITELNDALKGFVLFDRPQDPQIAFYSHTGEYNTDQDFYFYLSNNVNFECLETEQFMRVIAQLCEGFDATVGGTYDNYLGRLFGYEKRAYEEMISEVDEEDRDSVPKPYRIPGVEDNLPELLTMTEFDYHIVPSLIWWINFWSYEMVQTVGAEQVRNAPWAHQMELSNGSMVLAATDLITDVCNPEHLERLSEIAQALNLRELQEAHRILK